MFYNLFSTFRTQSDESDEVVPDSDDSAYD